MLLGIQHLVRQAFLCEQLVDDFGVLDRSSTHQHGLAALVALTDIHDCGSVLFLGGLVDAVELILTFAGAIGRNHHGLQTIDFLEFVGFGIGRTGHARQLLVQTEVVLEGDRGHGLVLGLNDHTFLGFHGLVQTIAPATASHQATRELIHDHDFIVLHHIVLIAEVQLVGTQRCVQVVHQRNIGRVVERRAFGNQAGMTQQALSRFITLIGQVNLMRFLIHGEVTGLGHAFTRAGVGFAFLAHQIGHNFVHGHIHGRVVFGRAGDDQWRTRFVDQDGVHLVDDGVVQHALHTIIGLIDHVVAQIVEAVLVVGTVGNVGVVRLLLVFTRQVGQVDTDRQTQEVVQARHGTGIAAGQVIVDGHHMHTFACQSVQIHGQRGGQRLAFAGTHFSNLAVMQRHGTQHLHVKVTHLHDALGALTHHGKRLWQQVIQRFTLGDAVFELLRLGAQCLIAELFVLRLHRIDASDCFTVLLEQPVIAAAEQFGEEIGGHAYVGTLLLASNATSNVSRIP